MTHSALLPLAVALGLRHGVDPDHLAAIDALSRVRPSRWNGVLFAIGHGFLVTLLAVGVGGLLARSVGPYTPWILLLLGGINLWRLGSPATHRHRGSSRTARTSPLLLGAIFGAGFETASQLSALVLAADINPWVLGVMFSAGMVLVDGMDGYLAFRTQSQAIAGGRRALRASRVLGIFVVVFSFGLGGAELLKLDVDRVALPLGCVLFVFIVALRIWGAREPVEGTRSNSTAKTVPTLFEYQRTAHPHASASIEWIPAGFAGVIRATRPERAVQLDYLLSENCSKRPLDKDDSSR